MEPDGPATNTPNHRQALGALGESLAARYLEALGYTILRRNQRYREGELDLIAEDGEYLVFVEVKTRARDDGYHPSLAVNPAKQRKLRLAGEKYLAAHPAPGMQPRFDVVSIVLGPEALEQTDMAGQEGATHEGASLDGDRLGGIAHELEHIPNAF